MTDTHATHTDITDVLGAVTHPTSSLPLIDMAKFVGRRIERAYLPISVMHVDHHYQRPADPRWVTTIARNFDPDLLDVFKVNLRSDGTYWLINGQHRLRALRAKEMHDAVVCCDLYTGLTVAEEAKLFTETQALTKRISVRDRWRARKAEQDPVTLAIDAVLDEYGLADAQSLAYGTIQSIFLADPALLRWTLAAAFATFRHLDRVLDRDEWNKSHGAAILSGFAQFKALYGEDDGFDADRLITTVRESTPKPSDLILRARARAKGWSSARAMTLVLVDSYNRSRGSRLNPDKVRQPLVTSRGHELYTFKARYSMEEVQAMEQKIGAQLGTINPAHLRTDEILVPAQEGV